MESARLRRLDRSVIATTDAKGDGSEVFQGHSELVPSRNADLQSFTYTEPSSRLDLATQSLTQVPLEGTIQEAVLTTTARPGARSLNRLRLLVQAGEASALQIKAPAGLSLVRLRRDGFEIVAARTTSGFSVPLENTSLGSKISTIDLEYEVEVKIDQDGTRLRPALPQVEMPCLSFVWEIITPSGWEPSEWAGGLVAYDPPDQSNWPFAALGVWRPWSMLARGHKSLEDADLYRDLDRRLVDSAADSMSFGEWFTRWDSGLRPVVIDRLSLDLAGFGPKSPCIPSGIANSDRSNISLTTLRRNGLALVPLNNGALVITTNEKAREFNKDDRFGELVIETLIWGSDRTDRLQTVARWRREPSPKSSLASGEPLAEQSRFVPGWSNWRFSSSDWPSETTSIRFVNVRNRLVLAWVVAAILFGSYMRIRSWRSGWRASILSSWLAAGLLLAVLVPARLESYAAAVVIAGFAAVVVEQSGRRFSRPPLRQAGGQVSEPVLANRVSPSITGALILALLAARFPSARASGPPDRQSAILALFPDDAPAFDPRKPLENVILRLADFDRLERLVQEASSRSSEPSFIRAISAAHRIVREDARTIIIESEYELIVPGQSPASWEIPVSSTRDIEVTLDGKPQAISIKPGGASAVLAVPPRSPHILRLRRMASSRPEGNFDVLRVPINAMPLARVIVDRPHDGAREGQVAAWGQIEHRSDQSLVGRLGPANRLEIRWLRTKLDGAAQVGGTIDGLILWDIHPAGDRVRAETGFSNSRMEPRYAFATIPT